MIWFISSGVAALAMEFGRRFAWRLRHPFQNFDDYNHGA